MNRSLYTVILFLYIMQNKCDQLVFMQNFKMAGQYCNLAAVEKEWGNGDFMDRNRNYNSLSV